MTNSAEMYKFRLRSVATHNVVCEVNQVEYDLVASLIGEEFTIEADEVKFHALRDVFIRCPWRRMRSFRWQCRICKSVIVSCTLRQTILGVGADVVEFKSRLAHVVERHPRGWRSYQYLQPHLMLSNLAVADRVPQGYFERTTRPCHQPASVVINKWELEAPQRKRAREWPLRHPNDAYVTRKSSTGCN